MYCAVNVKGVTYHLFNAKRYPLGRMATRIGIFIRGKHKPGYEENNFKNGDKCIVVNMGDPWVTGRKRDELIYRHHTGYAGGLKEIPFREMLKKTPEQILIRTLLPMLPKNELRKQMIKQHLIIYKEPYHNYGHILPQFTEIIPGDMNEELGINKIDPKDHILTYASDRENIPEELKELTIEWDDTMDIPMTIRKKTHTQPRDNFKLGHNIKTSYKNFGRFKDKSKKA